MPLSFPTGLQNLIASGWCRYHPFVELYLSGGIVLRYSIANIVADGNAYSNNLKNISGGKISLTDSVDRVTFTLYNADAIAGQQMIATRTPLDRVNAIVGTIYANIQNENEVYRVVEDDGLVNASNATDTELECVFISSTYIEKSICGDIKIDENCAYKYKSIESFASCGYSGSITTCARNFTGVNGCTAHFEYDVARERFGGHAMFLDDAFVQQVKKVTPRYNDDDDERPIKKGRIRRIYAKQGFYDL